MKPTHQRIQQEIRRLRKIVETTHDEAEKRLAYTVETALTWATTETVGWDPPARSIPQDARMLRDDLKHEARASLPDTEQKAPKQ